MPFNGGMARVVKNSQSVFSSSTQLNRKTNQAFFADEINVSPLVLANVVETPRSFISKSY